MPLAFTPLGGVTEGRILDIVVFAVAALIAYRFPRTVPFAAVFAVSLQSTLTHTLTSDGDALAGLAVGLTVTHIRSRRIPRRARTSYPLAALAALTLVSLLSFVANARGTNGHQVAIGTEYFISRSVLAAAVVFLSEEDHDWQYRWGQALGLLALVLSLYRLGEIAGLPLKPVTDALGIAVLGEYTDPSNANIFAVLVGVGIPFLFAGTGQGDGRLLLGNWVRWLAAALATFAMASSESRTAALIIAAILLSLFVLASGRQRRFAIGGLAAIYLVGSFVPAFSIAQKPVVVATQVVAGNSVATNQPPVVSPPETLSGGAEPVQGPHPVLPAIQPQWRSVLDRTYYRLEMILPPATHGRGHYLDFIGRTGGGAVGVELRVSVNGTLVAQLRPSDMSTVYRWQEVPLPDAIVSTGKPLTVDLVTSGNADSARDYFLVGGLNARANGYSSRFWTGASWVTSDLSSDPGIQTGLFAAFLDGDIPQLTYFQAPSVRVIDPSIADRFVLWQTALNAFVHNPVFGTGFYTFGLVNDQYQPSDSALFFPYANAHSNYFELVSDLGLAGPFLFLLVFLIPLVEVSRRILSSGRPRDWLPPAMALALFAFLVSSATQTWLADSRIYVSAWFVALVAGNPTTAAAKSWVGVLRPKARSSPTANLAIVEVVKPK